MSTSLYLTESINFSNLQSKLKSTIKQKGDYKWTFTMNLQNPSRGTEGLL